MIARSDRIAAVTALVSSFVVAIDLNDNHLTGLLAAWKRRG
jgi:hypothetical protein